MPNKAKLVAFVRQLFMQSEGLQRTYPVRYVLRLRLSAVICG